MHVLATAAPLGGERLSVDGPLFCTNLEAACASLAASVIHFSTAAPKHKQAGLGAGRRGGDRDITSCLVHSERGGAVRREREEVLSA